jgi:hypothetical protein
MISKCVSPNWRKQQGIKAEPELNRGVLNTTLKRRIAGLERTWPRPKSLADLWQDVINIVRLTGTTHEAAIDGLLVDLSYEDLKRIAAELKFGNDTVTRDAAKRKAMEKVATNVAGSSRREYGQVG